MLLAVPNVSEGRDHAVLDAIRAGFEQGGARVLDVHTDADHNRSVFTLAGEPGRLADAVLAGARVAVARIDIHAHEGVHPRVGAVDVAPIVHLTDADRGAACAEALVLADLLATELAVPVYMYGALAGGRTRAELRRGGPLALIGRAAPDHGPHRLHPTAGATLVAARPPLVAFNVVIEGTLPDAQHIATEVRAMPGVVALGLELARAGVVQVSTNIEDPAVTPAQVVELIRHHARVVSAELVALAPEAAFRDFPEDVPMPGFDPGRHLIERAINS